MRDPTSRPTAAGRWVATPAASSTTTSARLPTFFDHYLKDAPAPKWLADGVAYLDKDLKRNPN